ncbi:hypothetical protein ABIA32_005313 [Streptacidiphilus sp. MAP12-20]|uniref:hypothetical protein n=1 Tax=Streptacidiphilus sp. MAP12-20 TaxID=3156299 RepID=UPI0035185790
MKRLAPTAAAGLLLLLTGCGGTATSDSPTQPKAAIMVTITLKTTAKPDKGPLVANAAIQRPGIVWSNFLPPHTIVAGAATKADADTLLDLFGHWSEVASATEGPAPSVLPTAGK